MQVDKHRADHQQLLSHSHLVDSLRTQEGLRDEDRDLLQDILARWDRCRDLSEERTDVLAAAFNHLTDFEKTLACVSNFIDAAEAEIAKDETVPLSCLDVVEELIAKHRVRGFKAAQTAFNLVIVKLLPIIIEFQT